MKICFMCDLHLPFDANAMQYRVLRWAIEDILKNETDCIIFAGDATCDGNIEVYSRFISEIKSTGIPFLFIPGNSDLRCDESKSQIQSISSELKNNISGIQIFAVNDSNGEISDEQLLALEDADSNSIVFMHHPLDIHNKLIKWRNNHKDTMVFYGHTHKSKTNKNTIALQAMDPDKATGENPCITYFDTDTKKLRKAYYFSPVPADLYKYFGISCYRIIDNIEFAIKHKLECLELRPNCLDENREHLVSLIEKWRKVCGKNLSVHLPDITYKNGKVSDDKRIDEYINLAKTLRANRFTVHTPVISVQTVKRDKSALEKICNYLADKFNLIDYEIVIGVENMHMTDKDTPDDNRRFGYIPEECIMFMNILASKCIHKVGINFDIGHARNNMPFSQKYQISTWFSQIGKYIVGYHMHQVNYDGQKFENHMPITQIYGHLISFASFFSCWAEGQINKAPVIFEMRPEGAYDITLDTFNEYKNKNVLDIHSHT